MTLREVPAITLGTYYTNKSGLSRPNDSEMRRFVYIAKDDFSGSGVGVDHPRHPSAKMRYIRTAQDAHEYIAEIIAAHAARIYERLRRRREQR